MNGAATTTPGDQRDGYIEGKGLARLRVNQLDARRQRASRRREQEIENPLNECEGQDNADADRNAGVDDAFAELIEMLQKRHLPADERIIVVVREGL